MKSRKLYTSESYAKFRPQYPPDLYEFLCSIVPSRNVAWDAGTGTGLCAAQLALKFESVLATDIDPDQLAHAPASKNIDFRVAEAGQSGLSAHSVDLITAATAVHWFDLEAFYREARRVLVDGGILAVWGYCQPAISPEIDTITAILFDELLRDYWPDGMELNLEKYSSLPFPFPELIVPDFTIRTEWDLDRYEGFIRSCSGYRRRLKDGPGDALADIAGKLRSAWGAATEAHLVEFPLHSRVGRIDR